MKNQIKKGKYWGWLTTISNIPKIKNKTFLTKTWTEAIQLINNKNYQNVPTQKNSTKQDKPKS